MENRDDYIMFGISTDIYQSFNMKLTAALHNKTYV
jgi:hypothetical protein